MARYSVYNRHATLSSAVAVMHPMAYLYALQETDLAIDSLRQQIAQIDAQLGETEELIQLKTQVEATRKRIQQLHSQQRDLELETLSLQDKIKGVENKLYGGEITNPKELQGLLEDLQALKKQLSLLEDRLLTLMIEGDEQEKALRKQEERLSQVLTAWQEEQEKLKAERGQLEEQLRLLEAQRDAQVAQVAPPFLSLYEGLRARRQGRAVAKVERGLCGGCHIALPVSLVQRARTGSSPVQCSSCERILYVP